MIDHLEQTHNLDKKDAKALVEQKVEETQPA
jgi:hypothetical protein